MGVSRRLVWVGAVVGFFAWRNASFTPGLLQLAPLPPTYFVNGTAAESCTPIQSPPAVNGFEIDPSQTLTHCEDIKFWDHLGADGALAARYVVASCDPGRRKWNTVMGPMEDPNPRGALWLLTLPEPSSTISKASFASVQAKKIELLGYPESKDLHPLGIALTPSYLTSENENVTSTLLLANHGRHRTTVEQFTLTLSPSGDSATATYKRTLASTHLHSANAIALSHYPPHSPALGFYVTNDHLLTRRMPWPLNTFVPLIETVLALPFGWVTHAAVMSPSTPEEFSSSGAAPAVIRYTLPTLGFPALGTPFANGIAVSPTGDTLAVASSSTMSLSLFSRNASSNDIAAKSTQVALPFAPDNIDYADPDPITGAAALIVAGHPHFPSMTKFSLGQADKSPSWVAQVTVRADGTAPGKDYDAEAAYPASKRRSATPGYDVKTLYQSDGSHFSAVSSALVDGRTGALFLSGLYSDGVMICI